MTKVICPEDGKICEMKEEDKQGQGCWFCPKIQKMLLEVREDVKEGDEG